MQEGTSDDKDGDVAAAAKVRGRASAKQRSSSKAATKQAAKDDTMADGTAGADPSNAAAAAATSSSDDEDSAGVPEDQLPPQVRQQQEGERVPVYIALGTSMPDAEVYSGAWYMHQFMHMCQLDCLCLYLQLFSQSEQHCTHGCGQVTMPEVCLTN